MMLNKSSKNIRKLYKNQTKTNYIYNHWIDN